tara:strand:+ start:961 stop:1701 length:741 start_codon:yes stop_codon:yes gene_type:complete
MKVKRYSEWETHYGETRDRRDLSHTQFMDSQIKLSKNGEDKDKIESYINIVKNAISSRDEENHVTIMEKTIETINDEDVVKKFKPSSLRCFRKYNHDRDAPYELFMTYFKVLKNLYIIEKRQKRRRDPKYKPKKQGCFSAAEYNYYRWLDVGTPSISGYNEWKEKVKYGTLFLTLVSNCFKIVLAQMGGRASFVGTALQAIAHLSFALYFYFLTDDDKALAIPKIFGFIISAITCYFIAIAGNGFL